MPQATLYDPKSKTKKVVDIGSPEAAKLQQQGYEIYRAPAPALAAPTGNPYDPLFRQQIRKQFGAEDLEQKYQKGTEEYRNFATGQASFVDALKQELLKRDKSAESLEAQKSKTQAQLRTAPSEYRQELVEGGITDPFARQRLIAQREGSLQSAIDALGGQIQRQAGTREEALNRGVTGYQTNLERQKYGLEDIARQLTQKEGDIGDYFKGLEKDQDFQQESALDLALKSVKSGGGSESQDKVTQADKNDYNASLSSLGDVVVTSQGANSEAGEVTREEAIRILSQQYPWMNPTEIAKNVYELYSDEYR